MKVHGDFTRAAGAGLVLTIFLGAILVLAQRLGRPDISPAMGQGARLETSGPVQKSQQGVQAKASQDSKGSLTSARKTEAPFASAPALPVLPDAATLGAQEREEELAQWEARLEREEIIERLNAGRVADAERAEYGLIFERLAALKKAGLREDLQTLDEQVANLARTHTERLASVGVSAQSTNQ